jgi:hypothetical protein
MARQYNLKNLNGIHLKAPYDYTSYSTDDVRSKKQQGNAQCPMSNKKHSK